MLPANPVGVTGLRGRGLLGPNHAADPVVTRWNPGADGDVLQTVTRGWQSGTG